MKRADLSPEAQEHLALVERYCDQWLGRIVDVTWRSVSYPDGRTRPYWVTGHDGPYERHDGELYLPQVSPLSGWGAIALVESVGTTHYLSPALIERTTPHQGDWCPLGCVNGLIRHAEDYGPDYEAICQAHRPDDYARARDLYHLPWDGRTDADEAEMRGLIAKRLKLPRPKLAPGQLALG